ncbi:MAG: amino acid permease [Acidobacteria bacterium]|jgi:APA family basic amino acid/polyamine antiporter|nr:MAG: amino acid permease [Acidobacteriota bacterium]GIU82833.1 MAG: amino acid transporter [Pyrinomonadaceae bacterium]
MSSNQVSLIRGLGLIAAISIIIGNVIGTGVFLKARVMTCNVGSPDWVLIAWIVAGILSLAGALTYAELSAMKPFAGGEYVFLRDAYGKIWSFLYGWMQMFIAKTGSQAAVAVTFAIGLNDFLGGSLKQTIFKTNIAGCLYELSSLQVIAVGVILVFTVLNCASVSFSGWIATFLTVVKILLIAFVSVGAFVLVTNGSFSHFTMVQSGGSCEGVNDVVRYGSESYSFISGFGAAIIGALWGYDGWNNLTLVAGEVKKPERNIPIALIGGTIVIILLYVLAHTAYFYVLTPTEVASISTASSVAKETVSRFFQGNSFAVGVAVSIFTVGLMLSSIGTLHTSILTGARVPFAMARDGLMFESFGKLSQSTKVPIVAIIFQGVWASLLALSGSFDTLTDYVIFGSWIFYALVTSSVFVFRKKFPDAERPYKTFGYPVIPILFLIGAGLLLINALWSSPVQSFAGIFLILIGLPIYYYLTNRAMKDS